MRPQHQQVRGTPAQAVLPLDAPAAVDDALQIGLQDELRPRLPVVEAPQPVLRVLAEEGLEGGQQLVHVQVAVGFDVPGRTLVEAVLQDVAQLPGHHLRVDGVRHARRRVRRDQAQVACVLQVPPVVPYFAAA